MASRSSKALVVLGAYLLAMPVTHVAAAESASHESRGYPESPAALLLYMQTIEKDRRVLIVHAVLGCIAVGLFAPLGAVLIRLKRPGVNMLRLHAAWQLSVYAMYVVSLALGIWLRIGVGKYHTKWLLPHATIGYVVFGLLTVQPILGFVHHAIFKRRRAAALASGHTDSKPPGRTILAHAHIWIGRMCIALVLINGGIGIRATWHKSNPLQSEGASRVSAIIYGTCSGMVFLLYTGMSIWYARHRTTKVETTETMTDPLVESAKTQAAAEGLVKEMLHKQDSECTTPPASEKSEPLSV